MPRLIAMQSIKEIRLRKIWSGMRRISITKDRARISLPKSIFENYAGRKVYVVVYIVEEEDEDYVQGD